MKQKRTGRTDLKNGGPLKKTENRISSDILQLLFVLLAIFFFLSLISFSPDDPSVLTKIYSDEPAVFKNLFGNAGAWTSAWLGIYLGWASLLIPFLFAYISILLYRYKHGYTFFFAPIVGFIYGIIIIVSLSAMSGLIGGKDIYFTMQPAGGSLGIIGATVIASVLGRVGGIVVFIFLITIFVMLLFSVSFSDMRRMFSFIFDKISFIAAIFSAVMRKIFRKRAKSDKEEDDEEVKNEKRTPIYNPLALQSDDKENKENYERDMNIQNTHPILETEELQAIKNIPFNDESREVAEEKEVKRIVNEEEIKEEIIKEKIKEDFKEEEKAEPEIVYIHKDNIKDKKEEDVKKLIEEAEEAGQEKSEQSNIEEIREEIDDKNSIRSEEKTEDIPVPEPEIEERYNIKKVSYADYNIPINLLAEPKNSSAKDSGEELKAKSVLLEQKLQEFGVSGHVRRIHPGPVVTMYEYEPAPGTRTSKISSLENDLALAMSATSVRIIAPIPGTNAVGIEMPNKHRETVYMKELLQSPEFRESKKPLTVAIGKDSVGRPYMADLAKMPHLLVAGTTGSGKSVELNALICSMLYKSSPDKLKFIMIDPKGGVEFGMYDGIPHMLAPVVSDSQVSVGVLKNVVAEMERRYAIFKEKEVRSIDPYNEIMKKEGGEEIPYIVVIVDEFADLMMTAGKEVEASIIRIGQKARAAGINLILATQRPDRSVVTGLIKSNLPSRIALRVSNGINSNVILDQTGAEKLLGNGDGLYLGPGTSELVRTHGPYVSDEEVKKITDYLKSIGSPEYDLSMIETEEEYEDEENEDPVYAKALKVAAEEGKVSISMIQRRLKIGYNKAANIVETMEKRGIVPKSDGTAKPRPVNMEKIR